MEEKKHINEPTGRETLRDAVEVEDLHPGDLVEIHLRTGKRIRKRFANQPNTNTIAFQDGSELRAAQIRYEGGEFFLHRIEEA